MSQAGIFSIRCLTGGRRAPPLEPGDAPFSSNDLLASKCYTTRVRLSRLTSSDLGRHLRREGISWLRARRRCIRWPTAPRLCDLLFFKTGRIAIRGEVEPYAMLEKRLETGEQQRKALR